MDESSAKPPRKRRRWVVIAFGLAIISSVAWWNWPRGDARFVGKWFRNPMSSAHQWSLYDLATDGTGDVYFRDPDGSLRLVEQVWWRSSGDEVTIHLLGHSPYGVLDELWVTVVSFLKSQSRPRDTAYRAVSVSGALELQPSQGGPEILRRFVE